MIEYPDNPDDLDKFPAEFDNEELQVLLGWYRQWYLQGTLDTYYLDRYLDLREEFEARMQVYNYVTRVGFALDQLVERIQRVRALRSHTGDSDHDPHS